MRFFLALRLTRVLLIAQVTTPLATMMTVAAKTIQPPHAICGTNSRMSTRNARSETRSVGNVSINRASRYRGEWAGEWKCAATASPKHINVRKAATGCTIRIEDRECRVADGNENSESGAFAKRPSTSTSQFGFTVATYGSGSLHAQHIPVS